MRFVLAILFVLFATAASYAQGCGPTNPNCTVPTAPPGTSDNRAASTAFVQANGIGVANNAALAALTGMVNGATVTRLGFATSGDGGEATYKFSGPASCAGTDDDGWRVQPTNGIGCWQVVQMAEMDMRIWGIGLVPGANDTQAWHFIDQAVGQGLNTTILCTGTTLINNSAANVNWVNKSFIRGNGNCVVSPTAGTTAADNLILYSGPGPVDWRNITFSGPIFDPTTWTNPALHRFARLGPALNCAEPCSSQYPYHVVIDNVSFIGSRKGIQIDGASYLTISNIFCDRQIDIACLIIGSGGGSGGGGLGGNLEHYSIFNVQCRGIGGYCISTPVNLDTSVATTTVTPRDLFVENVNCDFCGFASSKMCYDITGTHFTQVVFKGRGTNCRVGGVEFKDTIQTAGGGQGNPNYFKGIDGEMSYFSNWDLIGMSGVIVVQGSNDPTYPIDAYGNFRIRSFTTFLLPGTWMANTFYKVGDAVQNGGKTFISLSDGFSAAAGGPATGTCAASAASAVVDNQITWICMEVTPSQSQNVIGAQVQASWNVDLTSVAYDTGFGVLLNAVGGNSRTIQNLTIRGTWNTVFDCIRDTNDQLGSVTGTLNNIHILAPDCRSGRSSGTAGTSAMRFGFWDGNGNTNVISDLEIIGGSIIHQGSGGVGLRGTAITCAKGVAGAGPDVPSIVDMKISGTRLAGALGALNVNRCSWTVTQSGGTVETTDATNGNEPITFTANGVNPSYKTIGDVGVVNAHNATKATWITTVGTGGTPTVIGTFVAPPSSSFPTASCNWGDVIPIDPTATGTLGTGRWMCALPGTGAGNRRWLGGIQVVGTAAEVTRIPACAAALSGLNAYVTDQATASAYRGAVTSGAGINQRIYCDGTNWLQD